MNRENASDPMFSMCHASGRPGQWKACYDDWWAACDNPAAVEYILAIDERWGFDPKMPPVVNDRTRVIWWAGKRGSTTAWNAAAAESRGQVLVMVADDLRPPLRWDTELLKVIPDLNAEFVVQVSSAKLPDDAGLMVAYLLSRKRYERLGYVINPEYIGIYADNEFGGHARQDGVVIDARHLMFRHHHPYYGDGLFPRDAVYDAGNTSEAVVQGLALYAKRKASGFPLYPKQAPMPLTAPAGPKVSVITPTVPERAQLLAEAKASVERQTLQGVEHLVAVDEKRVGQGFVRNELAKRAHGDWLVFLDDDDLLDPQFAELHLEHAEATGADVVYSICRMPASYTGWAPRIADFDEALLRKPNCNYIPVTALVRRSMFEEVGGFKQPRALDDWNLWVSLLNAGAKFEYLPVVSWSYRVHGMVA